MKKILSFAAILFVLTNAFSCGKEKEGDTTIIPCNLQTERIADNDIQNMEVWLVKELSVKHHLSSRYIYEIDGIPTLIVGVFNHYEICNFPPYVKEWIIPDEGLSIVISGKVFMPSRDHGFNAANYTFFDLELTSLEKK